MRVTTADFMQRYSQLSDRARIEPLTITEDGHDRLVVLSIEEYARLVRRDRKVVLAGSLSESEVAAIAAAEVPAQHGHLDNELTSQ